MLCINSQWVAGHMTALVMLAVGEFRVLYWCRPMPACISGNKLWHPDGYLIWCPRTGFSGGRPPLQPKIFSISCSFSQKFGKIICWHPLGGLAPPPMGNPGSAPEVDCNAFVLLQKPRKVEHRRIQGAQQSQPGRRRISRR